jgi:hypothetical protein
MVWAIRMTVSRLQGRLELVADDRDERRLHRLEALPLGEHRRGEPGLLNRSGSLPRENVQHVAVGRAEPGG